MASYPGFADGRSTRINALLGRDVLPPRLTPLTAVATTVRYGNDSRIEVAFKHGHEEKHPLITLADFVTEAQNPRSEIGGQLDALFGGELRAAPQPRSACSSLRSAYGHAVAEGGRAGGDLQEPVVFGDALAAGGGAGLEVAAAGADGEVGDEGVFGLAGAVGDELPVPGWRQIAIACRVSVTVPIWLSLISAALPMPRSMALVMMAGLVQKMSSPTSSMVGAEAGGQRDPAVVVVLAEAVLDQVHGELAGDGRVPVGHAGAGQQLAGDPVAAVGLAEL